MTCARYVVCFLIWITHAVAVQERSNYGLQRHPQANFRTQRSQPRIDQHSPSDVTRRPAESTDVATDAQRYFPSFSQIFEEGPPAFLNSRPPPSYYDDSVFRPSFRTPEFNSNSFGINHREQRESFGPSGSAPSKDLGMLGSGNFGVIRGGTYYAEERDGDRGEYALDSDLLPFYDGNGHGRPPFFRGNPKPLYKNGGNFFENFRDFADITPPSKSFSEFYVVYVNQNASRNASEARILGPEDDKAIPLDEYLAPSEEQVAPAVKKRPQNILEQLAMLDANEAKSKGKRKLNEHKRKETAKESRLKAKILATPKNPYDPLLALS